MPSPKFQIQLTSLWICYIFIGCLFFSPICLVTSLPIFLIKSADLWAAIPSLCLPSVWPVRFLHCCSLFYERILAFLSHWKGLFYPYVIKHKVPSQSEVTRQNLTVSLHVRKRTYCHIEWLTEWCFCSLCTKCFMYFSIRLLSPCLISGWSALCNWLIGSRNVSKMHFSSRRVETVSPSLLLGINVDLHIPAELDAGVLLFRPTLQRE